MIILTNCLTKVVDEGGMKVACSLAKHIKAADASVTVVSCGPEAVECDVHLPANKLMLNPRLGLFLHRRNENVLYIPAAARMLPTALRIAMLSVYTGGKLQTVLVMKSPIGRMAGFLLELFRAKIVALSEESYQHYRAVIGPRAKRLRTGVDTARYQPVDAAQKAALRAKYGIPADRRVVLHVGHLTEGRNLSHLLSIDPKYHVILVASTYAQNVKDEALRAQLLARDNVTLIHRYVPAIEEIYQLSDVYFFPVVREQCCIDVPLSALEAAACGLPVVATNYGELKSLVHQPGFYEIDSFDPQRLNALLDTAVAKAVSGREAVLPYDWDWAMKELQA